MKDMRWVFLLGTWMVAEVVGYYGLRRLRIWRRWMGWLTPMALGLFFLLWGLTAFVMPNLRSKLLLSEIGGVIFWLWLMLVFVKLLVGAWGILGRLGPKWPLRLFKKSSAPPSKEPTWANASPLTSGEPSEVSLERRRFLQGVAGALALVPSSMMGYAFFVGRYRYEVREVELWFPDLPAAFDGLKLVQFSDLHSGSYYFRSERLEEAWALITQCRPDLLCFTGDWVNVYADELVPFVQALQQLTAPLGKWAVLGNHDYGDYARWPDPVQKQTDQSRLRQLIQTTGFQLLEDASTEIKQAGEALYLVGTGNWGYWNRRQRYGDIEKAWHTVPEGAFVVLMTHDPTHWQYQVMAQYPAALALSGHTHGLQMGIHWGNTHWSPAGWLYKYWAGLYNEETQHRSAYLYVNRGLGYIALPARWGVWPEITLLRLRRGQPLA